MKKIQLHKDMCLQMVKEWKQLSLTALYAPVLGYTKIVLLFE
jgi:hypothetical protein